MALLNSLASEKQRWEAGSVTFKNQMATIIGDVLLSSAFMAYAGKLVIKYSPFIMLCLESIVMGHVISELLIEGQFCKGITGKWNMLLVSCVIKGQFYKGIKGK